MLEVSVNYLAILAAGVACMVLGSVWYGPLFGKQWMALLGLSAEKLDQQKAKGMVKPYALMFVGSLVMAYVLYHALVFAQAYWQTSGVSAGLMVGFFNWLGFVAPVSMGVVLWEGKSWKLWFVNGGFHLVALMVMGAILAVWM